MQVGSAVSAPALVAALPSKQPGLPTLASRVLAPLFAPPGREDERWAWGVVLALSVLAAVPYAMCTYLPLVDVPVHELEAAILSARPGDGSSFTEHYVAGSLWTPYWLPFVLAVGAGKLVGPAAGLRLVIAAYVAALPPSAALLARELGRSPWWGLVLVPFVLEFNLAYGFISYCFAGLLLLWLTVLTLRIRAAVARAEQPRRARVALPLVAAALGWTHSQLAVLGAVACTLLLVASRAAPWRVRAGDAVRLAPAVVPLLMWLPSTRGVYVASSARPVFAPPLEMLARLGEFSIDVFAGELPHVEEALFGIVVLVLALGWFARGQRPTRVELLPLGAAALALALTFVTPFDYAGQAIAQRMPFLALLCLPALAAPGLVPRVPIRALLVVTALVGTANAGLRIVRFDRRTAEQLAPVLAQVPDRAKLAYAPYAVNAKDFRAPVYLHAGAWATVARGGVYAFAFPRGIVGHRATVPPDMLLIGKELLWARTLQSRGAFLTVPAAHLSYWDAFLTRWPLDRRGPSPVEAPGDALRLATPQGRWGLFLRPATSAPAP